MKTKLILIISLFFATLTFAQDLPANKEFLAQGPHGNNPPRMEELRAQKWGYLVEKAHLTPEEEKNIRPAFEECEQKIWKILQSNRDAFRSLKGKDKQSADYEKINEALVNFEILKAQYQRELYMKLKKSNSEETIFRFLKADRSFTRELMNRPREKK